MLSYPEENDDAIIQGILPPGNADDVRQILIYTFITSRGAEAFAERLIAYRNAMYIEIVTKDGELIKEFFCDEVRYPWVKA